MSMLYLLPAWQLLGLLMLLAVTLCVQTLCVGYEWFNRQYLPHTLLPAALDLAILCQLGLGLQAVAVTTAQVSNWFFVLHSSRAAHWLVWVLLAGLSLCLCRVTRRPGPLLAAGVGLGPLLPTRGLTVAQFALLVFGAVGFWLVRGCVRLARYQWQRRRQLSLFSVKEAVDSMDFGILFCRGAGASDGQILLTNRKMQQLILAMTGGPLYNGKDFYRRLVEGRVQPDCRMDRMGLNPICTLPDGTVWYFDLQMMDLDGRTCAVLLSFDVSAHKAVSDALYEKNAQLAQRNRELKIMLQNLGETCRTEVTLRTKTRVHDLLGQRISMVLRAVREQQEPDEALLRSLAQGLPSELKNVTENCADALAMAARSFESLGVQVHLDGTLPPVPAVQKAFYEIAAEGMTNAVHHGFATEIFIRMGTTGTAWTLEITNNGLCKEGPLVEGGGLTGIRRRAEALGGSFTCRKKPCFTLSVQIPEGGTV